MEAARYTSRSVIIDPIYKTFRDKSYMLHKQKIEEISNRKFSEADAIQQQRELMKLKNSKKAAQKINDQLDLQKHQNIALITHIQTIMNRKSESFSSLRKFKSSHADIEKKQIMKQNRILIEKIGSQKMKKLTKKDIKKQIQQYESMREKLRKVKVQPKIKEKHKTVEKSKKSLNKSK